MAVELWQVLFWAALTVLLLVVEIATVQLVAVWFAVGSLTAFISSLFSVPFYVQVILFIAGSVVLLVATRPIVRRLLRNTRKVKTNADRVLGKECVVREAIDNLRGTGRVYVDGLSWAARSADDSVTFSVGDTCVVQDIQGVKLIVQALSAAAV